MPSYSNVGIYVVDSIDTVGFSAYNNSAYYKIAARRKSSFEFNIYSVENFLPMWF